MTTGDLDLERAELLYGTRESISPVFSHHRDLRQHREHSCTPEPVDTRQACRNVLSATKNRQTCTSLFVSMVCHLQPFRFIFYQEIKIEFIRTTGDGNQKTLASRSSRTGFVRQRRCVKSKIIIKMFFFLKVERKEKRKKNASRKCASDLPPSPLKWIINI